LIDERSIRGFGIAGGLLLLGVTKSFLWKESGPPGSGPWRLQLRAQFYNVLNNSSFYVASVNHLYVSNSTTFGRMSPLPKRKAEMAVGSCLDHSTTS